MPGTTRSPASVPPGDSLYRKTLLYYPLSTAEGFKVFSEPKRLAVLDTLRGRGRLT
ncbi:hypothetical protein AAJV73_08470 [Cyanobium sp. BSA11S]|uniref:hypothetical protein n=1 Tax=Cyanobium sp. BSA11S TaxID=3108224 RepID=UPI003D816FC3